MLILSRNVDEKVFIGSDIKIQIVAVRGPRVRLGIEAPTSIPVHRSEIFERITIDSTVCPCCGHKRKESRDAI